MVLAEEGLITPAKELGNRGVLDGGAGVDLGTEHLDDIHRLRPVFDTELGVEVVLLATAVEAAKFEHLPESVDALR